MNSPHLQPPCSSPVYTQLAAPAPAPPPPVAEAVSEEATDGIAAADATNSSSLHEDDDAERHLASPVARSSTPPAAPSSPPPPPKERKSAISKRLAKELNPCRALLEELEEHDESWPFLLPVNTKQFPTYRKIIRCPMDLSTIKRKLCDGT